MWVKDAKARFSQGYFVPKVCHTFISVELRNSEGTVGVSGVGAEYQQDFEPTGK